MAISDSGEQLLTDEPSVHDENLDQDEDDFSTGKALCALGVVIFALLMFTIPLSKVFLAVDMATHFAAHYMVVGGALLIGFFMPKWNIQIAAILAFLGVFLIGYLAVNKPVPVEKPAIANTKRVKLMTFNTLLRNKNWQAIVKEIKRADPDIVTMMEFGQEKAGMLKALKKEYPYQLSCFNQTSCNLTIFSKFRFSDSIIRVRWHGPPYARVTFGKELGNLNLYAVHTIRPPHYRAHYKQIGALSRAINEQDGLKIVMGDFNSTPFSRTLNTFSRRTKLKRLTDTPTWPTAFLKLPQIAIDHIFVSPEIEMLSPPRLGKNAGSDHFPVNTIVAIPNG